MSDNQEQQDFWSAKAGEKWISNQREMDALLAPVLQLVLDHADLQAGETVLDLVQEQVLLMPHNWLAIQVTAKVWILRILCCIMLSVNWTVPMSLGFWQTHKPINSNQTPMTS
jgi:hypothetical protein